MTYTLTVVATDSGKPVPFSTSVNVTILVIQPNNFFNPLLNQSVYAASIDEGNVIGAVLFGFLVADDDTPGPASQVKTAFLYGGDAQYFAVNLTGTNSGVVIAT